jgi:hypothetical protein
VKPVPPTTRNHPKVARRVVLRGGAAAALLPRVRAGAAVLLRAPAGAAVLPLVSCTSEAKPPPGPDPLIGLAARAQADAATAEAIVSSVPELATTATEIAKARREHAQVLQREIERLRPLHTPAPPASATNKPPAPRGRAEAKAALADALRTAEKQAGELVPTVPRYRAGMLGSIAAGCASLREVLG